MYEIADGGVLIITFLFLFNSNLKVNSNFQNVDRFR